MNALTDCRFRGSQIGARDRICGASSTSASPKGR